MFCWQLVFYRSVCFFYIKKFVAERLDDFVELFCKQSYKYRRRQCAFSHTLKIVKKYKRYCHGNDYEGYIANHFHISEFDRTYAAYSLYEFFACQSNYIGCHFKTYSHRYENNSHNTQYPFCIVLLGMISAIHKDAKSIISPKTVHTGI